jgi:hypothetical protein
LLNKEIEMHWITKSLAVICVLVASHAGAQNKSTEAPPPPFEIREQQTPEVKIAVKKTAEEVLKFGDYPQGSLPVLTYSKAHNTTSNVLFGISFTCNDSNGKQRQVFLTLNEPHTLSNSTGTITSTAIENFQLNVALGEQASGDGMLTIALFEAVASNNKDIKAGATTGGNQPMTFYSDKQKTSASYGRQISNVLKVKATVWHP